MKKSIKVVTCVIAAAAVLGGASVGAYAYEKNNLTVDTKVEEETQDILEEVSKTGDVKTEENLSLNDEVAYVFTNYDGSVNKVMDSIWIEEGENKEATEELPVDLKIEYELDGVKVTPSELEGESGHLKVTCNFTDNIYEERKINGRTEKIYVPFLASLVTVMDDETYRNVEISSGKVSYDGSRYAIVGLAFPGLSEDMGDSLKDIDIPNTIELEADVTDCEPMGLYLFVSNSLFNNMDVDTDDEIDDLKDALGQLSDAVTQLLDGSSKLYDGLGELENGAVELSDGVTQLSDGLNKINANSAQLNLGAQQVFNSLLSTATSQVRAAGVSIPDLTIDNYNSVLDAAIAQVGGTDVTGAAQAAVESQVRANKDAVRAGVEQAARAQVESAVRAQYLQGVQTAVEANRGTIRAGVLAAAGVPDEETFAMLPEEQQQAINSAVDAKVQEMVDNTMTSKETEIAGVIEAKYGELNLDELTEDQIQQLISDNMGSAVAQGNAKVQSGVASLQNLKGQLNSYMTFYQGINQYTAAVGTAAEGAGKIKDNMPKLLDGIKTLRNGGGQLSDGIKKFDEEGIEKLTSVVEDDVEVLAERFAAVTDVSSNYNCYDAKGEQKDGVKFIYKVSMN